jgi:lysophospholipid acyltransferase (LPLAT)-like uncharacterized protein
MKWLSRNRTVQKVVAWVVAGYLKFCIRTMRWTVIGTEPTLALDGTPQGYIVMFWHKVISLSVVSRRIVGGKTGNAMISNSSDGSLISDIVGQISWKSVRGSRGKEGGEDKGGAQAFRDSLKLIRAGEIVAITPDGPRGPVEVMPEGPVLIGRASKAPVFMFGFACKPAFRPNTWDDMMAPFPFGRGAIVVTGPWSAGQPRDPAAIEAVRAAWERELTAAQRRAEAIVEGRAH